MHFFFERFFEGFFDSGSSGILSATGLVFISYIGVTKVISVAGEIKDPERNLPLGLFLAVGTAITVYAVGLWIMIGVSGTEAISFAHGVTNLTPVSTVAADKNVISFGLPFNLADKIHRIGLKVLPL